MANTYRLPSWRQLRTAAISLLWLPTLVAAPTVITSMSIPWEFMHTLWSTSIGGLPLAVAFIRLRKHGYRIAAWVCGIICGLLTFVAASVGGLLGPVGVLVYSAFVSLPAWIYFGVRRYLDRRSNRNEKEI